MKYLTKVVYIGSIDLEIEADNEEEAREYAESYFLESDEKELIENIYKYEIEMEGEND